jgi:PleD family two-component response regulator
MDERGNAILNPDESGSDADAAQPRSAADAAYAPPRRRLLIVDDSNAVRVSLREALADLPAVGEIVEAIDGIDALSLLARTPVDLILTDITMPRSTASSFSPRCATARGIAMSW